MLFWSCSALLAITLVAGGGTHNGFYGDVAAQLLSIPLLSAGLWPAFGDKGARQKKARLLLGVCAACAFVIFVQLLPLPFDAWSGRTAFFQGGDETRFADTHPGWSTLSITPHATWAAAISLLVPLSLFGATMRLGHVQRMRLCWVVLGVGAVSLALGFVQVAQGESSPFRFYEMTNPTEAVGFFANRNHFAAFLNVTLVLSALWLTQTLETSLEKGASKTQSILWFAAAAAFFVSIVAALMMARSRAGAFLAFAALGGIVVMIFQHSWSRRVQHLPHRKTRLGRASLALALFAALFALQFASAGLVGRFEGDFADDLRFAFSITTFKTAFKTLPFGTGLGSFVPVYATVENGEDTVPAFVNHAHNDLAEVFLEAGLMGAVLLIIFLAWFGRTAFAIWMRSSADSPSSQVLLQRASTLVVAVLLLHSLVDYPLRTTALSAIFAFFCATLLAPVEASEPEGPKPGRRRHSARRAVIEGSSRPIQRPDMDWPETWQRKDHL